MELQTLHYRETSHGVAIPGPECMRADKPRPVGFGSIETASHDKSADLRDIRAEPSDEWT